MNRLRGWFESMYGRVLIPAALALVLAGPIHGIELYPSNTSLGTVTSGTWNGSVIQSTYGGTGVNNATRTLTLNDSATISTAAATVLDDATVAAMVDTLGGAAATGTGGLARATSPTFTGAVTATNVVTGYTTTATAAGTTTLTASSTGVQDFTGTTTQTVQMPVTSTLALGFTFKVRNFSTRAVTINSSGGNQIVKLAPGTQADVICILTSGTDATSWSYDYRWLGGYSASNVTFPTTAMGGPLFYPDGIWRYEQTLSSSDIKNMYATPVAVLAAPAAGKAYYLLDQFSVSFITHGGTTFTGGGTHYLQYGSTANGGGTQFSLSWAASTSGLLATQSIIRPGWGSASPIINPNLINGIGIWASNLTAAYATGDGSLTYRLAFLIQDVP